MNHTNTAQDKPMLTFFEQQRMACENTLRTPVAPEEVKRTKRLLAAIESAISIVEKTNFDSLPKQN
ncbi:MAG: hypothetical protein HWE26_17585 [Alteromonadaceae bacterium]|nr:hypothetical protein [Alteromonadaceae bacterium]